MSRQGRAKKRVGRGKLDVARGGRSSTGLTMSNEDRVALARSGTKDLLEGTREVNRAAIREKLAARQHTDSNN